MNNQKLIDAAVLRSIKIKKTIAIASKLPNFLYWLRACNFQLRTTPQDIPHLEARVDIDNSYKESSLNLHPSQDLMNQAYKVRPGHIFHFVNQTSFLLK